MMKAIIMWLLLIACCAAQEPEIIDGKVYQPVYSDVLSAEVIREPERAR